MTELVEHTPQQVQLRSVPDPYAPHRNLRVDDKRWKDFGDAVGIRKRSTWLLDFIEAVIHSPQTWREFRAIAEARGETFPAALVKSVRLYRDAG